MKLVHGGDIYSSRNIPGNRRLIDFSANINPLGLPESVREAIINGIDDFSSYPDPLYRELKKAIAAYENVPEDYIICGNGAADIIFRIAAAVKPGCTLLTAPTFSEYEEAVKIFGSSIQYHCLQKEKDFNLDETIFDRLTQGIDLMFLCNPNNPTGVLTEKKTVLRLAERCKANNTLLAVDECFIDFLENPGDYSIVDHLKDFRNVIVLKAFTKIFAMAGIRLGYGLCSDEAVIDRLYSAGQPWSVSVVAQKCGTAALKEKEYVRRTRVLIAQNREYLTGKLRALGLKVFDSKANYIMFRTEQKTLLKDLEQMGILIRPCGNYAGLDDSYYRIAVKSREDNEYLFECMKRILE